MEAIDKIWLPAAIRYEIPFETFWNLNPKYMEMYQDDYLEKRKQKQEELNILAWLNGQYFISSIQVAFNPKKTKYPKQPFGQKEMEEVKNPVVAARRFEDFAAAFNKKFENKQVDSTQ